MHLYMNRYDVCTRRVCAHTSTHTHTMMFNLFNNKWYFWMGYSILNILKCKKHREAAQEKLVNIKEKKMP